MRVHWTDRAKTRLRLIQEYIARDAPLVALEVVERLVKRSILIGQAPHAGRQVPDTGVMTFVSGWNDPTASSTASAPIVSMSSR